MNIEKQLESVFRTCEELKLLQNERAKQDARNKVEDSKNFDELMSQLLSKNPTLAELFGAGKRLSSAFNLQPAGEEEKELDLKEFPTYFHHRKLDADETLKRSAAEDKPIRLNFTTDANDDYFIREERPGVIKVSLEGEKFKDEKILFSSSLRNGVYSINITQPDIAEIGDILKYKFESN
jgi:hypothetical protein